MEQSDFSKRISDILPKVIADIIVKDIKRRIEKNFDAEYAENINNTPSDT